ncbi:hypothetical protein EI94DRAFT_1817271 [Lactarius quietus]|nr:hypothetical protein EI94DRAFT_1817271 [Lactarius quietus]
MSVVLTGEQLLDCHLHMPVLEILCLEHSLPMTVPAFSTRTVSLLHPQEAKLIDCVDSGALLVRLPALRVQLSPPSPRISPALSSHWGPPTSSGRPHVLVQDQRRLHDSQADRFACIPQMTVAQDCESYLRPIPLPDVCFDCEWDAGDPDMEPYHEELGGQV